MFITLKPIFRHIILLNLRIGGNINDGEYINTFILRGRVQSRSR